MTDEAVTDTFAVVTGGGTAGHVLPALAIADALVDAGHDPSSIRYIGSERGVETRLLVPTPYHATFLDVVGVQRRLTRENLGFVPKMLRARRAALRALRAWRPEVVISVGGYASMAAVFAADRLDIPVVVVSYDRTPGRASRLAARRAAACAVAFETSTLPRAELTGAPVGRAVLAVDRTPDARAAARRSLGVPPDRFLLVVMGGSLGSGVLNDAVARYVDAHADDAGLAVRQIAGERFASTITPVTPPAGGDGVIHQVIGYDHDMAAVYNACDLLIGRGGASTVHEVAATGTPAILVPWAASADDHQTANVAWLADVDAAVMVREDQLDGLGEVIDELRSDAARRADLGAAARTRGQVHRSGALARLIERVALAS